MKKPITLILALTMTLTVTGCAENENSKSETTATTTATTTTTTAITTTTTQQTTTTPTTTTTVTITTKPTKNDLWFDETIAVPSRTVSYDDVFTYDYGTVFKGYDVYEFDNDITVGAVALNNLQSDSPTVVDYEAYYGIKAWTEGEDYICFTVYNHSKDHPISNAIVINSAGAVKQAAISYENGIYINTDGLDEGLYAFRVSFDTMDMYTYFYIADNGVFTCRVDKDRWVTADEIADRRALVQSVINDANIRPDNSLDNSDIVYPQWDSDRSRCDTDLWIDLSYELVGDHPDWSDEFKLFVFNEWMMNNIKYDEWRYRNGQSRAAEYNDWTGKYSMWDLRVGVCADFTNVMVIMLREHGIPATSLENNGHMWLAVYLDGEWREFDTMSMMPYYSYEPDASDCVNIGCDYGWYGFWTEDNDVIIAGEDIWTYNRAKYGYNVYN